MYQIPFTFQNSKGMSKIELSSQLRLTYVKLRSAEKIEDEELLTIFNESLKFVSQNLDDILLDDLISLIQECWYQKFNLLWEKKSEELKLISKKNPNGMIIVASISAVTTRMKEASKNFIPNEFFEKFILDSFHEIEENYNKIENKECEDFVVFDQSFNRLQILHFLYELIQAIPYSEIYLSKYLQFILDLNEISISNTYRLFSFFISNNMINYLPRKIFTDENFINFLDTANSLILFQESNNKEFLQTYRLFYQKIIENEYNNSMLARSYLIRISKIKSKEVFNFLSQLSPRTHKTCIQALFDFSTEKDFPSEILLNLMDYKFRLPDKISRQIKSLDDNPESPANEFLVSVSSNPLLYIDRSKVDPILFTSNNQQVYLNLFRSCDSSDHIFKDLRFWTHFIPLFELIDQMSFDVFIQTEPETVPNRISSLLHFEYPNNMKVRFFNFAKIILKQTHSFEAFLNSKETADLLKEIDKFMPVEFWKLFCSHEPILAQIDGDYEGHLPLTLGLSFLLIHQSQSHSTPEDPKIKSFKVAEQTENSINELYSLIKDPMNMMKNLPNLSNEALSVVAAAFLYVAVTLSKFAQIEILGVSNEIFPVYFAIISEKMSSLVDFLVMDHIQYYNNQNSEYPTSVFVKDPTFKKRILEAFEQINYDDPHCEKNIRIVNSFLQTFNSLNDNLLNIVPIMEILSLFDQHESFYYNPEAPFGKTMASFFSRFLRRSNGMRNSSMMKLKDNLKPSTEKALVRLFIAYPNSYFPIFQTKNISDAIKEEKAKDLYNINIIRFLLCDQSFQKNYYYTQEEILDIANHDIEKNEGKNLKIIIRYGKIHFPYAFYSLLSKDLPSDLKINILCKMIPYERNNFVIDDYLLKIRDLVSAETMVAMIKETNCSFLFKGWFRLYFYILLDNSSIINQYLLKFDKQFDFSPLSNFKYNSKTRFEDFKIAFVKCFTILKISSNSFIIKRPNSPEIEHPSNFSIHFLELLINDFLENPSWQIELTLHFIAVNLPFLFIFCNDIDRIICLLFENFKLFDAFQFKQEDEDKKDSENENHEDENHENADEKNQKSTGKKKNSNEPNSNFQLAIVSLHLLCSLVSIPKIADQFFQFALPIFPSFTVGQAFGFTSTLIPILNRETSQHIAVSYLIRYDWTSLFKEYYNSIETPISDLSKFVLINLIKITWNYFLKYADSFGVDSLATYDELNKFPNPFEISYEYKTQISPIFQPWLSVRDYSFKPSSNRYVVNQEPIQYHLQARARRPHFFNSFAILPNRNLNLVNSSSNAPNNPADNASANNSTSNSSAANRAATNSVTASSAASSNESANTNSNASRNVNTNNNQNSEASQQRSNQGTNTDNPDVNPRVPDLHDNSDALDYSPAYEELSDDDRIYPEQPRFAQLRRNPLSIFLQQRALHLMERNFSTDSIIGRIRPPSFTHSDFQNALNLSSILKITYNDDKFMSDSLFKSCVMSIESKESTEEQNNELIMDEYKANNDDLDLTDFENIGNSFAFQLLDASTQAIILKSELKLENLPSPLTPKMHRYLITQPNWVTAFLSKPPTSVLLTPQHYIYLKKQIKILNEMGNDEDEAKEAEQALSNFKKDVHSQIKDLIELLLSEEFSLKFLASSDSITNHMFMSISSIISGIASKDDEQMKFVLGIINEKILKLNPFHIEKLLNILISLKSKHFDLNLLQNITEVIGSPSIRTQYQILETSAIFLTMLKPSNSCSESNIENAILQVFSILLNSPDIQVVHKAIDLIGNVKDETKNKLSATMLNNFNLIMKQFNEDNSDENIASLIFSDSSEKTYTSLFMQNFIIKFPELFKSDEMKEKLLFILKRILKLKRKNKMLISIIINFLVPDRTRNNFKQNISEMPSTKDEINLVEEEEESIRRFNINKYNKPILIPMNCYNQSPEFWDVIFNNLSWFQEEVSENPEIIDDKFKFMKNYMELLTFKQKCIFFRKEQYSNKIVNTSFELVVKRNEILKDSFYKLKPSSPNTIKYLKSNIHIKFKNEPGFDMGGLTRDWFTSLIKELFNPGYALFSSEDNRSFQPNPASSVNENHLEYFEFAGMIIGRAIIAGVYVDAHLTTSFIKQILGIELNLHDLKDVDKKLYNSLVWILKNPVKDAYLNFTTEFIDIDTTKTVELVENGENISVTDENKKDFVQKLCKHIMIGQIKDQITAFTKGFYKMISKNEISLFTPTELDLLICGIPEIDVEDLKNNCVFDMPYQQDHAVIRMFFKVISKWPRENLAKLLLFITGSSQVPVGGFKMMKDAKQPIIIAPGGDSSRLPQAHTCANTLDLPEYKTEELMEQKLLLSISECNNFGFH